MSNDEYRAEQAASHDLRCIFCGAGLWVDADYEGHVESIDCNGPVSDGCFASWKPDGTYIGGGESDGE